MLRAEPGALAEAFAVHRPRLSYTFQQLCLAIHPACIGITKVDKESPADAKGIVIGIIPEITHHHG